MTHWYMDEGEQAGLNNSLNFAQTQHHVTRESYHLYFRAAPNTCI